MKIFVALSVLRTTGTNRIRRHLFHACNWNHMSMDSTVKQTGLSEIPSLEHFPLERIRNFSIIAHVDHGKSTLADRILEITGAISSNDKNEQVLDKLQVERERGITVKAQSASIVFHYKGQDYLLNLIDTPGHVDFTYEVSRSLAACDGVVLLVDANDGVQAQTVANFYLAFANNLTILPALNKIDLKNANPDRVIEQLFNLFEMDPDSVLKISAKLGIGIKELLEAIIERIPSPVAKCKPDAPLKALLFDSWFDKHRGVVCLVLVIDGILKKGDELTLASTGKSYQVRELGILTPNEQQVERVFSGQVGYFVANIRSTKDAQLGDTIHRKGSPGEVLTGFRAAKPMVFAGIYPMDQSQNVTLRSAIEKLTVNDGSVSVHIESSAALGQGWRLGFLGLLHMDVFNQRLEQEYGAHVVITTPSVPYKVRLKSEKIIGFQGKSEIIVNNPSHWPELMHIDETYEPIVMGTIITPDTCLDDILSLCKSCRGTGISVKNFDTNRLIILCRLPLNEIVVDFYDTLKSVSSGFATFDYEDLGFESSEMVKMNILLNGKEVEELSNIVSASRASLLGRRICLKLKEFIPQQLFQISIQASVRGKILAREDVKALRKNVLAKCYGGDVSRKVKLLKRQAEGKKRMRMIGNIEIPRDAFIDILKR